MNKVVLGTAQFGMHYGINNKRGKIPEEEVFEILSKALISGIHTLDTAYSYGESETIIGKFNEKHKNEFSVISKLPKCDPHEAQNIFYSSLNKLHINTFYGYIIHSFHEYVRNPEIWSLLEALKSKGKVKKIGFSLYFPHELEQMEKNKIKMDLVQVPYNVFDQRFMESFPQLKHKGIEIHTRSVFLQGLFFKKIDELNGQFTKIKSKIEYLNLLSLQLNMPLSALCLNFAMVNKYIDKVVVGVDNANNLREIICSSKYTGSMKNVMGQLRRLREDDEKIILPINWSSN